MLANTTGTSNQDEKNTSGNNQISVPSISLPKGGGAIRGIGEKFGANPVTGTGSMTVPIAASPGRSGFGPQLSLSYDSGAGNGPFGLGWNLPLPAITRKTDKGLPRYQDAQDAESDVFILSGAEDLVPILKQDAPGKWTYEELPPRTVNGTTYRIRRYRPRVEGLFAHIERWTNAAKPGDVFWRSISKENITTWYGRNEESRIVDPSDSTHSRIFSWLICETYDDKGNIITYHYKAEDAEHVDLSQAHQQNRGDKLDPRRTANRYLKRVRYGNHTPYLPKLEAGQPWPDPPGDGNWYFEVVFDYGEHDQANPAPQEAGTWTPRPDPFSSYRSTFEVRTHRLCQRVLMFHHVPDDPHSPQKGYDGLVRSTDFTYEYEKDAENLRTPIFSKLIAVTQRGYQRQAGGDYLSRSLPPVEFTYSDATIQTELRELRGDSLASLPIGIDGAQYQWVDLDGEGLSGVLTEQAGAWFYKRNLSPTNVVGSDGDAHIEAKFAPLELVSSKPAMALAGHAQFLDLAGDGRPDVVQFAGPTPGFYERTMDEQWDPFVPFVSLPNVDWSDPNLKFIDLDGDGHADILISEHDAFVWHRSLGEDGFDAAQRESKPWDEEQGPRIVFADGEQSISLADMSGDGLSDIVRIRNSEVCYWPNLGYGRFGAKVTMDNAPLFDHVDQFDHRRIRLADIDGTGTTDLLYLHREGVRVYFNQSGNSWSAATTIKHFPALDNVADVQVLDLLGNGTACLTWSSPLPADAHSPLRYLDLMGGQKPHLLVKTVNNLGAETTVEYAPSTRFYLQDKAAGKPWITKLPFPVHCVEKVTVHDKWRKTTFSTTYSYHHGYFDGSEREFRGFGRVEQIDVEDYGTFAAGNTSSPYITDDQTLYQPPVKTVTWYHTGAFLDRERILSHFQDEYFPNWFEAEKPGQQVLGTFQENALPEPDLDPLDLSADEWREALRACKGMMLRQEVYELDVDALAGGTYKPTRLFSTAYHNCHIHRVQPQAANQYAVFHVTESEAITYHYELDLRLEKLTPDPRIAHTLNLSIDEYGNIQQSVAVVYPRREKYVDATLKDGAQELIQQVQSELHLAYTETHYTNDVPNDPPTLPPAQPDLDNYRLRLPCEVLTYEVTGDLTGVKTQEADGLQPDVIADHYFTLDELRAYKLSNKYQTSGMAVEEIAYHVLPNRIPPLSPQKRIVEHARTLFFDTTLDKPLELGKLNALGLPYESYKLALTDGILGLVFKDKIQPDVQAALTDKKTGGYLTGVDLAVRFGTNTTGQYWMCSGVAGFNADAPQHYYLPERYTNPFGNPTTLIYDPRDLYIQSSTDALGNRTEVTEFDFRVLAPRQMKDANDNLSEVRFDILGMPAAMAVMGKGNEGDNLSAFDDALLNPDLDTRQEFFVNKDYSVADAKDLLRGASARHVYYFGEIIKDGTTVWGQHPACACGIVREQHEVSEPNSAVQCAFEYSDGTGNVLVKKVQAEPEQPGGPLRWIASGKTILNNKGKPVKQYEPYFSPSEVGHRFDDPAEVGVTPVIYYDAVGRVIRTESPDSSYSYVEFSPWHVRTFDRNDTVKESKWYTDRNPPDPDQPLPRNPITGEFLITPDQRAAWLAAQHADMPGFTILDSLGRDVIVIAHNRYKDSTGTLLNEKYLTYTKLDTEGKPLWIRDARRNLVIQYINPPVPNNQLADPTSGFVPCYDIAGNLLYQHSMDAGDRWMLMDAAGKPVFAWDFNQRQNDSGVVIDENRLFFTHYDALHRPIEQWLTINSGSPKLVELYTYGEELTNLTNAKARNLRGQLYQHYDPSGLNHVERLDFKGNPRELRRTLTSQYKAPVIDWQGNNPAAKLETETFVQITEYDALNRMTRLYNWHRGTGSRVAVYEPHYNARGLLKSEDIVVRATKTATSHALSADHPRVQAIREIAYNAKGQKESISYANGTVTRYDYDPETFRLIQLRTTRPGFDPTFPNLASSLKDAKVLQNLYYTYDPVGNITEIRDDAYEPAFFRNQQVEAVSRYTYDALYRLIEATGRENYQASGVPDQFEAVPFAVQFPVTDPNALRNYTQTYSYDPVGNIMQMRHVANGGSWTRHYEYATDSNRLLRTWEGNNTVAATQYRYDEHGNMLNLANVAAAQSNRWDYQDMIRSLNLQGGGWAYYNYDAGKQRTRKVIESQTSVKQWERIYLGGLEIYRRYSGGNVVEEIESLHLFEGDQRVLLIDDVLQTDNAKLGTGPLYQYQYSNHLGSACLEVDDQANLISYEEYHPYGTSAYRARNSGIEVPPSRYRCTGMERDEESGLSYHGARYYATWLGRWVTCDPKGPIDSPNLYCYVIGNPIRLVDPTGYAGVETKEVLPEVDRLLKKKNITSVKEISFNLLDKQGNKVVGGRADRVFRDPRTGQLIVLEGKGENLEALNAQQPVYVPVLESQEGAQIQITSRGANAVGLPYGTSEKVTGEHFVRVGRSNVKDFADALEQVTTGDSIKYSYRPAQGATQYFKTAEEMEAFVQTKGMQFKVPGAGALKALGVGAAVLGAGAALAEPIQAAETIDYYGQQLGGDVGPFIAKTSELLNKSRNNSSLVDIVGEPYYKFDTRTQTLYRIVTDPWDEKYKVGDLALVAYLSKQNVGGQYYFSSSERMAVYLDEDESWHLGFQPHPDDQGIVNNLAEWARTKWHDLW